MDAESFKKEFLPFHRKLYHIAFRLLENEADAEDLVQEAYLKLWDKRDGLAIISNPEAFSVTLIKNMCFDMLRSEILSIGRSGNKRRCPASESNHCTTARTTTKSNHFTRCQRMLFRRNRTYYRIECH